MNKIKLGVIGLMSMFVLSLGLGNDIKKDDSNNLQHGVKLHSEHGWTI